MQSVQLLNARDMAQKTIIGQDRIVYSTERDFVEQDYEAKEWDRRFREIEKADWEVAIVGKFRLIFSTQFVETWREICQKILLIIVENLLYKFKYFWLSWFYFHTSCFWVL